MSSDNAGRDVDPSQLQPTIPSAEARPRAAEPVGIRPPGGKTAYDSKALLARQADMATHSVALAALLRAFLTMLRTLGHSPRTLSDTEFVVNFGSHRGDAGDRYVFKVRKPEVAGTIEMWQTIDLSSFMPVWNGVYEGRTYRIGEAEQLAQSAREVVSMTDGSQERSRVISLD